MNPCFCSFVCMAPFYFILLYFIIFFSLLFNLPTTSFFFSISFFRLFFIIISRSIGLHDSGPPLEKQPVGDVRTLREFLEVKRQLFVRFQLADVQERNRTQHLSTRYIYTHIYIFLSLLRMVLLFLFFFWLNTSAILNIELCKKKNNLYL